MSPEGVQGAEVLGLDGRGVGQPLLEGGQDLDPLDRVDPQVGVQRHVQLEHLRRVARLLRHHRQQRARDVGCGPLARRAASGRATAPGPRPIAEPSSARPPGRRGSRRCRRRVRSVPRCSGLTAGASGSRSCRAERISTRLIESIPRSASRAMSSSSISAGYPVFSATTASRMPARVAGRSRRLRRRRVLGDRGCRGVGTGGRGRRYGGAADARCDRRRATRSPAAARQPGRRGQRTADRRTACPVKSALLLRDQGLERPPAPPAGCRGTAGAGWPSAPASAGRRAGSAASRPGRRPGPTGRRRGFVGVSVIDVPRRPGGPSAGGSERDGGSRRSVGGGGALSAGSTVGGRCGFAGLGRT